MKKRFISTLLLGAFFIASTSMVVSCKDYDDDINSLQSQIDKAALASDVSALQTTVKTAADNASTALKTATDAATQAGVNATAIANVKATADKAATDVATAIANAAKAQTTADNSATAAANAQKTADQAVKDAATALASAQKAQGTADKAAADAASALEKIGNIEKNYVTSTTLATKLEELKSQILATTTTSTAMASLTKEVDSYKGSINYLYSAITSVELFGSYTGSGVSWFNNGYGNPVSLNLVHGTIAQDSKFGDNEAYRASAPIVAFVKGNEITSNTGVIIRVNPTNADLTKSKIVLINSKGEVLSQVEAETPEKYTELITTRSTTVNSGLWKVKFRVAKGITEDEFNNATMSNSKTILYAVAINNTAADTTNTAAADRYVASTWDVAPSYSTYEPASTFSYSVTGTNGTQPVDYIHNRWNGYNTVAEDNTNSPSVNELKWAATTTSNPTPATTAVTSGTSINVQNAGSNNRDDARSNYVMLPVEVNKEFVIEMSGTNASKIAYYYAVLDSARAIESAPSEWNAWHSYGYEGLNKTVSASDKLSLKITSDAANGDVIGFRVYAVNYDGTLADPDGRAFYVQVGQAANTENVSGSVQAIVANNGLTSGANILNVQGNNVSILPLTKTFASSMGNLYGTLQLDAASSKLTNGANVYYALLDNDKNIVTNWKDAKYIAVSIDQPGLVIDGSTLSGTIQGGDYIQSGTSSGSWRIVNTINLSVKKTLPDSAPDSFGWKDNQLTGSNYQCYVSPNSAWNVAATTGSKDLAQSVNGLAGDNHYVWTIGNAKKASTGEFTDNLIVTGSGVTVSGVTTYVYTVTVDKSLVDGATKHATTLSYIYPGVSCTSSTKTNLDVNITAWSGDVTFACPLATSVQTYAWAAKAHNSLTYGNGTTAVNLFTEITGANSFNSAMFAGDLSTLYKDYTGISAKLISNGSQQEEYFTASVTGGVISFTPVATNDENNPTANVASTLILKMTDAFGHDNVYSLPFTVKKR